MVDAGCPKKRCYNGAPTMNNQLGFLQSAGVKSLNDVHDIIVRGSQFLRQEVALLHWHQWLYMTKTYQDDLGTAFDRTLHQWVRSWYVLIYIYIPWKSAKIAPCPVHHSAPPTLQRLPIHLVPQLSLRAQGGLNSERCEENMTGCEWLWWRSSFQSPSV